MLQIAWVVERKELCGQDFRFLVTVGIWISFGDLVWKLLSFVLRVGNWLSSCNNVWDKLFVSWKLDFELK